MSNQPLIKDVKKLLVEAGLDGHGSRKKLSEAIGVNKNQLSMALTGYRTTAKPTQILTTLKDYLTNECAQKGKQQLDT